MKGIGLIIDRPDRKKPGLKVQNGGWIKIAGGGRNLACWPRFQYLVYPAGSTSGLDKRAKLFSIRQKPPLPRTKLTHDLFTNYAGNNVPVMNCALIGIYSACNEWF